MAKHQKSGRSPDSTGSTNSDGTEMGAIIFGRRPLPKMFVVPGVRVRRQLESNPSELMEDDFEVSHNHLEEKYLGI